MSAHITFCGGVGSVTGANFLLDTGTTKLLVDCGLKQGDDFAMRDNAASFPYDPSAIHSLIVTHAHADHIGRIPKLVKDGFRGVIYSTTPTKDLSSVMLRDALNVMQMEAERDGLEPLFGSKDIDQALALWKTVSYHEPLTFPDDVTLEFVDAGHILGSGIARFTRNGKVLVFTGDIGNAPQPLLSNPEVPTDASYMVMESVYGNRVHEQVEDRSDLLLGCIKDTIRKNGTLIIPAFSLERTQIMLFEINNFVESGEIHPIPVFLDSPLAIAVTDIYRGHRQYLKQSVREQIDGGDDIFDFPKLKYTKTVAASAEIGQTQGAKIIIAGSGMSHGGRVRSHEIHYLSDPKTTLLLVGYQTVGSVGRLLQDGVKRVSIDGVDVKVKARIEMIRGYSGHADRDALIEFVSLSQQSLKKVFVTMGEERASLFLVQRLRDYLSVDAVAPEPQETAEIDW